MSEFRSAPESDPTSSGETSNLPAVPQNLLDFIQKKSVETEITDDSDRVSRFEVIRDIHLPEEPQTSASDQVHRFEAIRDVSSLEERSSDGPTLRDPHELVQQPPEVTCNYDWGPTREIIKALYPEPAPQGEGESSLAYTQRLLQRAEGNSWDPNGSIQEVQE